MFNLIKPFGLCLLFLFCYESVYAFDFVKAQTQSQKIYEENKDVLQGVERFLNSISTFNANFVQIDKKSKAVKGKILIKRPGKILIEYDESKIPVVVVVRDGILTYFDKKLEQASNLPVSKTIASLLVKRVFSLRDDDVSLISVLSSADSVIVVMQKTKKPEEGEFKIVFKKNNDSLDLSRMEIIDPENGDVVRLDFYSIEYNKEINDKEFDISVESQIPDKFKK